MVGVECVVWCGCVVFVVLCCVLVVWCWLVVLMYWIGSSIV